MSQYGITQADIENQVTQVRLRHLTDDENTGTINTPRIAAAIVSTEAELHRYAGVHYSTPLRTSAGATPEGIREFVVDGAVWRLTTRRTEFLRDDQDEAKFWATWRKDSVRWLEAIASATASGRIPIPGAIDRTTAAPPRGGEAVVYGDEGDEFPAGFMRQ